MIRKQAAPLQERVGLAGLVFGCLSFKAPANTSNPACRTFVKLAVEMDAELL